MEDSSLIISQKGERRPLNKEKSPSTIEDLISDSETYDDRSPLKKRSKLSSNTLADETPSKSSNQPKSQELTEGQASGRKVSAVQSDSNFKIKEDEEDEDDLLPIPPLRDEENTKLIDLNTPKSAKQRFALEHELSMRIRRASESITSFSRKLDAPSLFPEATRVPVSEKLSDRTQIRSNESNTPSLLSKSFTVTRRETKTPIHEYVEPNSTPGIPRNPHHRNNTTNLLNDSEQHEEFKTRMSSSSSKSGNDRNLSPLPPIDSNPEQNVSTVATFQNHEQGSEIASLKSEKAALESEMLGLRAEKEILNRKILELYQKLEEKEKLVSDFNERHEHSVRAIADDLYKQYNQRHTEKMANMKELFEKKNRKQVEMLEHQIKWLEDQLKEALEPCKDTSDGTDNQAKLIQSLQNELQQMASNLARSENTIAQRDLTIRTVNEKYEILEKEYKDVAKELKTIARITKEIFNINEF